MASTCSSPQQPPANEDLLKLLQSQSALKLYNSKYGANYMVVKVEGLKSRIVKDERCFLTLEFQAAAEDDDTTTTLTFVGEIFQRRSRWWPILCYQLGKLQEAAFARLLRFHGKTGNFEAHARGVIAIYNEQHGTNYEVVNVFMMQKEWGDSSRVSYQHTITFKTTKMDDQDHRTTFEASFVESSSRLTPPELVSCHPRPPVLIG